MNGKILVFWLAALLSPGLVFPSLGAEGDHEVAVASGTVSAGGAVDVHSRPLPQIPVGTRIGKAGGDDAGPPKGWTNLVMLAKPRLGVGDVDSVSKSAAQYSGTFLFTVLANVGESAKGADAPSFFLEKVAVGGALEAEGKTIVATSDQTFGNDLGFLGRKVFAKGERVLANDFRQVARTRTMLVFDAHAYVRYDGKHSRMVIRHVVLVAPKTGRLTTFVWLLGSDGKGGYARAETTLQLLPPALYEDRVMSVDGDKFTLGIPSENAFALARIPQGTPIRFSPPLSTLAAIRHFNAESVTQLEAELQTRYAPLTSRIGLLKTQTVER